MLNEMKFDRLISPLFTFFLLVSLRYTNYFGLQSPVRSWISAFI